MIVCEKNKYILAIEILLFTFANVYTRIRPKAMAGILINYDWWRYACNLFISGMRTMSTLYQYLAHLSQPASSQGPPTYS